MGFEVRNDPESSLNQNDATLPYGIAKVLDMDPEPIHTEEWLHWDD